MRNYLRYILSPSSIRQAFARRHLHKMKGCAEDVYVMALAKYLSRYRKTLTLSDTAMVNINVYTNDIGELMSIVSELHQCITTEIVSEKYFRSNPVFYSGRLRQRALSEYSLDDGYFVDAEHYINKMLEMILEIEYALTLDMNEDMSSYYNKKARRTYQELIQVFEALI